MQRTAETESIKAEAVAARGVNLKFLGCPGETGEPDQGGARVHRPGRGWDHPGAGRGDGVGSRCCARRSARKFPWCWWIAAIKVSDDSLYATLIASDFIAEGRQAAEWLAKKMNGKASIIELQGTPGAAPAIDRKKGFEEGISKFPDMKIIASQSGDFRRSGGKEVMEALLKKYGNEISAVYAHNDDMALGAIQALEEAGRKPGEDVMVISIDGVKGARLQAMVAKKLNCTVECNPLLGPMAFAAIEETLKGEKLPKKTTVQDKAYDQSTAGEAIASRKY